jgi:hypothetical protein
MKLEAWWWVFLMLGLELRGSSQKEVTDTAKPIGRKRCGSGFSFGLHPLDTLERGAKSKLVAQAKDSRLMCDSSYLPAYEDSY